VSRVPSIDEQISAIGRGWPTFKVHRIDDRTAAWRGTLRPLLMTFEITVFYRVPAVIEILNPMRHQPQVRVVSPPLRPRSHSAEGKLPHVYWDGANLPILCLFDPEAGEWSPSDLLAETTLPWSDDWLACYEGWRATGEWTGGGRHIANRQGEAR